MKKRLLPILLLSSLFVLGGCVNKGGEENKGEEQGETVTYGVAISNKTELQAEWFKGDAQRSLTLALTPEANALVELGAGNISVTSSKTDVIAVTGFGLTPIGAGKSTITVTYHDKTDSVELEVKESDPRIRYGTEHEGTEADPFTNEDAVKVAEAAGSTATSQKYFVRGVVESFRDAPSDYGNVSFYFTPAQANGKKFLAYRVKLGESGANVTDEHIWIGGTATVYCNMYNYNGNTPENSAGYLVSCTGEKQTIQNHAVNVAEAIAACKELGANGASDGKDTYDVTGYIVAKDGGTFFLSDTKGAAAFDKDHHFEVYNYAGENASECTVNAKVKVSCTIKYYQSSKDATNYAYETSVITSVTILEAGDEAAIPVTGAPALDAIEAGHTYKLGLLQVNVNENCFFKGTVNSSKYAEVSQNWADAADVEIESVTGGLAMKVGSKYLNPKIDGTSVKCALEDTPVAYTWNAVAKTLIVNLTVGTNAAEDFYLGTYGTNRTFSFSKLSYIVENGALKSGTSYASQFYAAADLVTTPTALQINQRVSTVVGGKVTLFLTANPYNFNRSVVQWESSATGVATVANGVVTAVGAGTATITAKVGDIQDTCEVTVKTVNSAVVENPVADTEYLAGIAKENVAGTALFIDGTVSSNKLNTTLDPTKGAKAKLIAVDGGYKVTIGGKYLNAALSGTYANLALKNDAKDGSVFAMDANIKSLTIELSSTKYYIGTYANGTALKSTQLSLSKYSFIWNNDALVEGQYPLVMLTGSIAD